MIKGYQIPICLDAAKRLSDNGRKLKSVAEQLDRAGLHEDASELYKLVEQLMVKVGTLDSRAAEAYNAARSGTDI